VIHPDASELFVEPGTLTASPRASTAGTAGTATERGRSTLGGDVDLRDDRVMMKILLAHHSHDGQTTKVAQRIAERLRASGLVVVDVDVDDAPAPDGYPVVILGDSIRLGRHSRALVRYLRHHHEALAHRPVALFQVSMTSAGTDAEHAAEAQRLVEQLVKKADVQPRLVAAFAGVLRYPSYGWVTRRVMRSIARREGNATDTTRDHEYTDWHAVDRFADEVAALASMRDVPS
jgi:menaquinone-dependent protoporphyrinogen oxidase